VDLPEGLIALPRQPSPCFVATMMPDGAPQMTQTWVDTDGEHVLINTVQGFQKLKNLEHDPWVAVSVADPARPSRYYEIRGRVVDVTTKGGPRHRHHQRGQDPPGGVARNLTLAASCREEASSRPEVESRLHHRSR
jgi:PPOX class probable F420-dependent enzyme